MVEGVELLDSYKERWSRSVTQSLGHLVDAKKTQRITQWVYFDGSIVPGKSTRKVIIKPPSPSLDPTPMTRSSSDGALFYSAVCDARLRRRPGSCRRPVKPPRTRCSV